LLTVSTAVTLGLLVLIIEPAMRSSSTFSTAVWLCFNITIFCSAAVLLCRWRLIGDAESAWFGAVLLLVGIYLQPDLHLASATYYGAHIVPADLVGMAVVVWMLRSGARGVTPSGWRHPVALGLGAGAALVAARAAWVSLEVTTVKPVTLALVTLAYPLASVLGGRAILRMRSLPSSSRWYLTVALVVGVALYHVTPLDVIPDGPATLVATATGATAGIVILATSFTLLREALVEYTRRLVSLSDRAARAELLVHREEEMRHEVRAMMAGISSASRLLIISPGRLQNGQAESLRRMLEAEMSRLEELLAADTDSSPAAGEPLDLDRVLEPLVTSQRSQGAQIDFATTGLTASGRRLEVSQAVHALLCNARLHAPGARIEITSEAHGDYVTLRIRDDGPGVPDDLHGELFRRRAKGATSGGQGLGLYSARRAIRSQGGDLVLEPSGRGAVFALKLPR
jgi:signal transduction histidine kinase